MLFGLGDIIAQFISAEKGRPFELDLPVSVLLLVSRESLLQCVHVCLFLQRAGRASIFGCFILGPLAHLHFNFLEWLIVKRVRVAAAGMGIDQ